MSLGSNDVNFPQESVVISVKLHHWHLHNKSSSLLVIVRSLTCTRHRRQITFRPIFNFVVNYLRRRIVMMSIMISITRAVRNANIDFYTEGITSISIPKHDHFSIIKIFLLYRKSPQTCILHISYISTESTSNFLIHQSSWWDWKKHSISPHIHKQRLVANKLIM